MKDFYVPFEKALASAGKHMQNLKAGVPTEEACKKCGAPVLKRIDKMIERDNARMRAGG